MRQWLAATLSVATQNREPLAPTEPDMPHQDHARATAPAAHHQDLKVVLDWLTAGADFAAARKIALATLGLDATTAASYQAFLKLLRAWTTPLVTALSIALRRRMREDLAERFTVAGFAAFGVAGSRLQLPRTASNQGRFAAGPKRRPKAAAKRRTAAAGDARRKKADSPQLWVTTMFHLGAGLPWDWRTGPTDSSERAHLREMFAALPADALVVADAGFVGYETWGAVRGGRHLLVRVGANVRLLRGLGYARERAGLVSLWPDRQAARGEPPLVLRLVVAQGGRHPVYLVTSVLDEARLPDRQVIAIYRLRWGVELLYRHFKQTFGRRKLRSHQADNADPEAGWSLVGLWALALHGQAELSYDAIPASRISAAGLLRAYRAAMRHYHVAPEPGESLWERLGEAVIDPYGRSSKASRDYPRKKREAPIGAPEIRRATDLEIARAQQIKDVHPQRLTA
jgi:hypothetical protein